MDHVVKVCIKTKKEERMVYHQEIKPFIQQKVLKLFNWSHLLPYGLCPTMSPDAIAFNDRD